MKSFSFHRWESKGYKTTGHSLLKNLSASYTGINGLRIGGSLTINNAPLADDNKDASSDSTIAVQLFEINAKALINHALTLYKQDSFSSFF